MKEQTFTRLSSGNTNSIDIEELFFIDGNDDRIGYLMITIGHSAKYPGEEVLLEKADVKQLIEKLQIHYLRMVE